MIHNERVQCDHYFRTNIFRPTIFLHKIFWDTNLVGPTFCLTQNIFDLKFWLTPHKFVWTQYLLDQFWTQHFFGLKICLVPNLFWTWYCFEPIILLESFDHWTQNLLFDPKSLDHKFYWPKMWNIFGTQRFLGPTIF